MITLRKTTIDDAVELIKIQKEAFKSLYEKYQDDDNPYLRDEQDILSRINRNDTEYYTIVDNEKIVGGILYKHHTSTPFCEMLEEGEYYLCRVYIRPDVQGKQIARTAIKLCEAMFPDAKKFYVDFPEDLEKNRRCYESVGYTDTGKRLKINEKLILSCYCKGI